MMTVLPHMEFLFSRTRRPYNSVKMMPVRLSIDNRQIFRLSNYDKIVLSFMLLDRLNFLIIIELFLPIQLRGPLPKGIYVVLLIVLSSPMNRFGSKTSGFG